MLETRGSEKEKRVVRVVCVGGRPKEIWESLGFRTRNLHIYIYES